MPEHFIQHAHRLTLREKQTPHNGLRKNQMGAICAVVSHFTLRDDPALVAMPTGSGKTAVLIALAYCLHARRVLVITPSVLVRQQITEGFRSLEVLKVKAGVLPGDVPAPEVQEVTGKLTELADWEALRDRDVVVAAPNSISPALEGIHPPPEGLFDLVLVDEAHHEAATSWRALLEHFPDSKKVLCSATPFRNDRKDLGARIVYHYPLKKAQQDGIFGDIKFEAVRAADHENIDVNIARKAEEIFKRDQALGHRLVIRTTLKKRAGELKALYRKHTQLRVEEIHSDLQISTIDKRMKQLKKGELDGIICVDMMGEGLDFPDLKIAAIHAPHKSLAITLQFIGRFARAREGLGHATFIAEETKILHDEYNLYTEDSDWKDIIANLSDRRVSRVVDEQDYFDTFQNRRKVKPSDDDAVEGEDKITLAHLEPFFHVKVYRVSRLEDFDLNRVPSGFNVRYQDVSETLNVAVMVWREDPTPKWLKGKHLKHQQYHLLVVYFDPDSQLMFVCSSQKDEDTYGLIANTFVDVGAFELAAPILRRAMTDWNDPSIYNLGMRNKRSSLGQESYRILTGSSTHHTVSKRDGQTYARGHAFGGHVLADGTKRTLGISSNFAKLWSLRHGNLKRYTDWCKEIAQKLTDETADQKSTPIDMLDGGRIIRAFPDNNDNPAIAAEWPYHLCTIERKVAVHTNNGRVLTAHPIHLEVQVVPEECTTDLLRFNVVYQDTQLKCQLNLSNEGRHEVLPDQPVEIRYQSHRQTSSDFGAFLDGHAPTFYFSDLSMVTRNVGYLPPDLNPIPLDEHVEVLDWDTLGVDIQGEITSKVPGKISIHGHLWQHLQGKHDVVFFDHDKGEVADFITLDHTEDPRFPVRLAFYHCKGSSKAFAGSRVEDLYEVCGQAVKCLRFRHKGVLQDHLEHREKLSNQKRPRQTRYVTGTEALMRSILAAAPTIEIPVRIYIVQPGMKFASRDAKLGRLLDTVLSYVTEHGCYLRVLCS